MLSNCRCICGSVVGRQYSYNPDGYEPALLWRSLSDHIWHFTRHGGQAKSCSTIIHQPSWFIFQFTLLVLVPAFICRIAPFILAAANGMSNTGICIYTVLARVWSSELWFPLPIRSPFIWFIGMGVLCAFTWVIIRYIIIPNTVNMLLDLYIINRWNILYLFARFLHPCWGFFLHWILEFYYRLVNVIIIIGQNM